jgi:hypothetical protein
MRFFRSMTIGATAIATVLIGLPATLVSATTVARTSVTMYSQSGDYIGQGIERLFLPSLGSVTVTGTASYLQVNVSGGTSGDAYTMTFGAPSGKKLKPRTYLRAQRAPFAATGHPGIDIYGDGRGCNEITGRFDVKDIAVNAAGRVTRLWIVYEQHCEGGPAALFGEVMYRVQRPASPFFPASAHVWFPDAYLGASSPVAAINVVGTSDATGASIDRIELRGTHAADYEIRIDSCTGTPISSGDICQVFVRLTPTVAGPRSATLVVSDATGVTQRVRLDGNGIGGTTSVTLESDLGDYIGGGADYSYAPSNATITVGGRWAFAGGGIDGDNGDRWSFSFEAPSGDVLAPGTTFDATRYPFNGAGAGMSFSGNGRGCNTLTGTFTVNELSVGLDNSIRYASIDFEQHCEGGAPALHGEIRYRVPGPDRTAPAAPTSVHATRVASGRRLQLTWTNPPSDVSYLVVRYSLGALAPSLPTTQFHVFAGDGTSATIAGLNPARRVSVSVFAVDDVGNVGPPARLTLV